MKAFTAALALAAGVAANSYPTGGNVTYTTEVVTSYETYCPGPTTITYGQSTYTVSEATTLTITDCPCTVSKPIYTTSSVICSTCSAPPAETPVYPTVVPPTNYPNSTVETPTTIAPTGGVTPVPTNPGEYPTAIPTAGAGKAAALSGAGLAGVIAVAALL